MAGRHALLIGTSDYEDPELRLLESPLHDVADFARVLRDPTIGAFTARVLMDRKVQDVRTRLEEFLSKLKRDDLVLVYFSCHGILDESGHLYLAMADTRHQQLRSTALEDTFIRNLLNDCRSTQQVLVLDCCYSGAFNHTKAANVTQVGVERRFPAHAKSTGRTVLTASDATQFAFDGRKFEGTYERSLFTHYLVEGLKTGAADRDRDGEIEIYELYGFVFDQVTRQTENQRPGLSGNQNGPLYIAHAAHRASRPSGSSYAPPPRSVPAPPAPAPSWRRRALDTVWHGRQAGLVGSALLLGVLLLPKLVPIERPSPGGVSVTTRSSFESQGLSYELHPRWLYTSQSCPVQSCMRTRSVKPVKSAKPVKNINQAPAPSAQQQPASVQPDTCLFGTFHGALEKLKAFEGPEACETARKNCHEMTDCKFITYRNFECRACGDAR